MKKYCLILGVKSKNNKKNMEIFGIFDLTNRLIKNVNNDRQECTKMKCSIKAFFHYVYVSFIRTVLLETFSFIRNGSFIRNFSFTFLLL